MESIFKHNSYTKYLTKSWKDGYNSKKFSLLDVYLKEKGPSAKVELLNIFKGHHIVAKLSPMAVAYYE